LDEDVAKLQSVDCDYVLAPSVEEMYPTTVTDKYSFGIIEEVMEGPRRPGHFSGVAVVVRRLFDIVEPRKAYFGEKDFQQIAIIKNLVKQINYDIEIVPCPIVRADDGLALSSRNKRLSPENRAKAPKIHATLSEATQKADTMSVAKVKQWVMDLFTEDPAFDPEYFEIVEDVTLQPVADWNDAEGIVGCIAVWMDDVRLIDIIRFK
ncbi:MAG: pantoate--beta-alanine ligase, partial [Bacteroidales bacterium]|nr:pantoate--beta-alanine ligase [Bacteroidales bacterium]